MPLMYLRKNLPTSSALVVSQLPCVAKLDQNESPIDLPQKLKKDILDELARIEWNRYPQPTDYDKARENFAQALNLDPKTISLTAGCDQAIQGAHFLAGGPGRRALVFDPTYPMLYHAGLLAGTDVERISLGPMYSIDPSQLGDNFDLILVASPNNPTGQCIPAETINDLLSQNAFIFIDEAYYDLSNKTYANLIPSHPNLMIGRSCSKSLLAGMRLGYTIHHPEVTLRLDQLLTAPYHLSHAQLVLARRYGEILPYVTETSKKVIAERNNLAIQLEKLGLTVYPSETNFLLIKLDDAEKVSNELAQNGIRVRYAPKIPGMENHLRISVGTEEQNNLFMSLLRELMMEIGCSSDRNSSFR